MGAQPAEGNKRDTSEDKPAKEKVTADMKKKAEAQAVHAEVERLTKWIEADATANANIQE